jgi:phosphatidylserine/phosphatidylglycerophosphate/cardiolipin synthase-like enzyme
MNGLKRLTGVIALASMGLAILLGLSLTYTPKALPATAIQATEIRVYFTSPTENHVIEPAILQVVASAKKRLLIAMYSFTDDELGKAVCAAKERGVSVWILVDGGQDAEGGGKEWMGLLAASIPLVAEDFPGLLHHKFAVIDDRFTITGSFNWSDRADRMNFENVVIIDAPEVAAAFTSAFWTMATETGTGWTRP